MARKALGRGLGALLPEAPQHDMDTPLSLPLEHIFPNPQQPRHELGEEGLRALAGSIREHGVLQPILVRRREDGEFEIVAGERRWRAAGMAELDEVPVRIVDLDSATALEVSLVENIQREDLSPLDVAEAIAQLLEKFGLTQEQAAQRIGWSRAAVTNKLRLLTMPETLREDLRAGRLSEGHCRPLLALDEETMLAIAARAVEGGLSVREVEHLARRAASRPESPKERTSQQNLPDVAHRLEERYGFSIRVTKKGERANLRIDGLEASQIAALLEAVENAGEKIFPGK